MAFPLLLGVGGLSSSLSTVYHVGKGFENRQFWNDYYRNTGYRPRYPFRSGAYDDLNEYSKAIGVPYLYSRGMSRSLRTSRGFKAKRSKRWYR